MEKELVIFFLVFVSIIIIYLLNFLLKKNTEKFEKFNINDSNVSFDNGNPSVVNNLIVNSLNLLPEGMIIAFSGEIIPDGWVPCDGGTYTVPENVEMNIPMRNVVTPNLVDRFIRGGKINKIGSIGGSDLIRISIDNMPSHKHDVTTTGTFTVPSGTSYSDSVTTCLNYGIYCGQDPVSSHVLTEGETTNVGSGEPISFLPEYYVLIYLYRLPFYKNIEN